METETVESGIFLCIDCQKEIKRDTNFGLYMWLLNSVLENKKYRCKECYKLHNQAIQTEQPEQ